ncbi:MAG: recombinase family protein [Clostridium sp.]|nr:recombinase family protein [Acetatifactor muris]MCM1527919.1 recombinase family protein [Bacteroides sp.]MCM1564016.1 recombinase family protein [Clostridium sp.]
MKIAIYARKSVYRQDSVSIETQIDECKRFIGSDDSIEIYQDEGFSGKNTERPDFQRMINDVEYGLIKKIVVYKLDRFSRNIIDFHNVYQILENHNCSFESVLEGFKTNSASDRFFMRLLADFAQMERENISQRVKDSYYFRAKTDGRWLGGKEPFGFTKCKVNNLSSLQPNDNINLVIEMYSKYAEDTNISLHQLVKYALDNYSVKMSATQVRNILSNSLYVKADKKLYDYYKLQKVQFVNDESEFNGTRALQIINKTDQTNTKTVVNDSSLWVAYLTNWQGVIDSRTFIIVQERLAQNKSYAASNKSTNKMLELSGLVKCAKCGHTVKMKGKYGSLSCVGRSEYRGYCSASFRGVKLANIQELVAVDIQQYFDNFNAKLQAEERAKKALKSQIDNLKREIDILIDISLKDELLRDATIDKIRSKQEELTKLQLEWRNGVSESDKIESRVLHGPIKFNGQVIYKDLSTEQKQSLLRIIVKRILLNEDGTIQIEMN